MKLSKRKKKKVCKYVFVCKTIRYEVFKTISRYFIIWWKIIVTLIDLEVSSIQSHKQNDSGGV